MNKKLTAKIQKLVPILGEKEHAFSSCLTIEPDERELILKKGSVYTVYDLKSPVELDVSLINKVINDVLYDSYYHSDNISPIQSLEKAVVNINEKITSLAAEEQNVKGVKPVSDEKVKFDIMAGVLWGNVLYIVQYGDGSSFLMRQGEINEVSSTSEGNFSVASGVVKDDDVIVLATQNFSQKYPPGKLLDTALSSNDLEYNQSSMILKFMVDTEFTEEEVIDFNLKNEKKVPKVIAMVQNLTNRKDNKKDEQEGEAIATLADTAPQKTAKPKKVKKPKKNKDEPNIKLRASRDSKFNFNTTWLIALVVVLLFISLAVTVALRGRNDESQESEQAGGTSLTVPRELRNNQQEQPQEQPQEPKEPEEPVETAPNLALVATQPFYDIQLADENADPSDIVLFNQTVVATDPVSGKIFTSDRTTPKFEALEDIFAGITNAENYEGSLSFSDSAGYKIYDLVNNTTSQTYEGEFGVTSRYLGNIYSAEGQEIVKYVPSGDTLTSSTWADNAELVNVQAMDIAFSIYTLNDNELSVYTQGEKVVFEITGLETPLNNPTDIVANNNFDNIYIADAGNNRIVIINSDGELIKQLKAENAAEWNDVRSISVSTDESTMFILSGSKVFEVDLTNTPIEEPAVEEPAEE